MPEGHVLHRAARLQGKRFNGRALEAESPQGRFADGAARINGQTLDNIEATGKHLFYRFESGDVVHVHLGLFGKFRMDSPPFPDPSPNARLLLSTDTDRLHLAGPTACALLTPDEVERVQARLGPDPLMKPVDGLDRFRAAVSRRAAPIGQVLLDQKAIAGLGNVYRSELLFLAGVHPLTPARDIEPDVVEELWELATSELKAGERSGRIVTVRPEDLGLTKRSEVEPVDRAYVYRRPGEPCRRCSTPIAGTELANRKLWWCPECQPAR